MKIQTFSIVAGSEACNARCPFCISKMTVPNGVTLKEPEVNWHNFYKACRLAQMAGCTTAMITGKGEPTLFPIQILSYLKALERYDFPIIELQTNGIPIVNDSNHGRLKLWHSCGLSTIAISVVHYDPEKNKKIYTPYAKEYIDLRALIAKLHDIGFSVRVACVLLKGYLDTPTEITNMIGWAKNQGVEQLTLRPVNKPEFDKSRDAKAYDWTNKHSLNEYDNETIQKYLDLNGTKLMSLMHGATVYDVRGQNVCLTGCLTMDASKEDIRQLIFFPDGHLRYDWQYEGAIIL